MIAGGWKERGGVFDSLQNIYGIFCEYVKINVM